MAHESTIRSTEPRRLWRCGLILLASALMAQPFRGAASCAPCHPSGQSSTHHAQALRRVAGAGEVEKLFDGKTVREQSGVALTYRATPEGLSLLSQKGEARLEALLEWAFGAGAKAITLVGRAQAGVFEHRISWYAAPRHLSLTPGHPDSASPDPLSALGVFQKAESLNRCFNCHATGFRSLAASFEPGVQCERCHGPGERHIALAQAKKPSAAAVVNGGRMSGRNAVLLCAECHRSPSPLAASPTPELDSPTSIRFAPVGFLASKCFQKSRDFSCQTCHSPHENLRPASDTAYAQVCAKCHAGAAKKACPRQPDCIACHMTKDEPLPHLSFTDHRIRIHVQKK